MLNLNSCFFKKQSETAYLLYAKRKYRICIIRELCQRVSYAIKYLCTINIYNAYCSTQGNTAVQEILFCDDNRNRGKHSSAST